MDFYPNKGLQSTATVNMSMPSELPKIGDKMFVMVKENTFTIVGVNTLVPNGCDVIVLKVEGLKKAKMILG